MRNHSFKIKQSLGKNFWVHCIHNNFARKWGTYKSAGNPRCAVHAEIHSICTARPRPFPAVGVRVSPTSDTCQSVAILVNRRHSFPHEDPWIRRWKYKININQRRHTDTSQIRTQTQIVRVTTTTSLMLQMWCHLWYFFRSKHRHLKNLEIAFVEHEMGLHPGRMASLTLFGSTVHLWNGASTRFVRKSGPQVKPHPLGVKLWSCYFTNLVQPPIPQTSGRLPCWTVTVNSSYSFYLYLLQATWSATSTLTSKQRNDFCQVSLAVSCTHAFHKKLFEMPGSIAARSASPGLAFEMLSGVFGTCLCNIACVGITFRLMFAKNYRSSTTTNDSWQKFWSIEARPTLSTLPWEFSKCVFFRCHF